MEIVPNPDRVLRCPYRAKSKPPAPRCPRLGLSDQREAGALEGTSRQGSVVGLHTGDDTPYAGFVAFHRRTLCRDRCLRPSHISSRSNPLINPGDRDARAAWPVGCHVEIGTPNTAMRPILVMRTAVCAVLSEFFTWCVHLATRAP